MANRLDKELYEYILLLNDTEKELVLRMLKVIVAKQKEPAKINVELYNKEIDEAIARVEAGEFYTHEEVERILMNLDRLTE